MRKIISILIALGLVLSLTVMATPVAAKVTSVVVSINGTCAGQIGVYNITFNASASLTQGVHCVCIKFPEGTIIQASGSPVPWFDGDITINGDKVFGSEVTVTGTEVCFLVPKTYLKGPYEVIFTYDACIINPDSGYYQLEVYTCREPDSIPVKNANKYKIVPCISSYIWAWNSNLTYPGIAEDFIPPFKACGQADNATLGIIGAVDHPWVANATMNAFNLTFVAYPEGCYSPCETVDLYVSLIASPQFPCFTKVAKVTLNLTDTSLVDPTVMDLVTTNLTWDPCTDLDGIPDKILIEADVDLPADAFLWWTGLIHFDTVGDYTLCFTAMCKGGPACQPPDCGPEGNILVQRCIDFKVHQWKDAAKVVLDEKWNLISLPLVPFDTEICAMLASLDTFDYWTYVVTSKRQVAQDNLLSIWYYDPTLLPGDPWLVWGNGQSSLTTIEDGKAYWFRLRYPLNNNLWAAHGIGPPGVCGNYSWWVFGTEMPEPPASPAVYPVVGGWNMVGVTSMTDVAAKTYLWNWDIGTIPSPVIYGWNHGCFAVQHWNNINFAAGTLVSGQGYWMAFPFAGTVFQVTP